MNDNTYKYPKLLDHLTTKGKLTEAEILSNELAGLFEDHETLVSLFAFCSVLARAVLANAVMHLADVKNETKDRKQAIYDHVFDNTIQSIINTIEEEYDRMIQLEQPSRKKGRTK